MTKLLFLNIFVILVVAVVCEEQLRCENMPCPVQTTGCKKHIKTSNDKRSLEKTISCLDENNDILKEYFLQEPNTYGEFVSYESTSYSNTHTSTIITNPGHNVITYNNYPNTYNGIKYGGGSDKGFDGLEDFE